MRMHQSTEALLPTTRSLLSSRLCVIIADGVSTIKLFRAFKKEIFFKDNKLLFNNN